MTQEISLFEKFKETGKHGIVFGIGAILKSAIAFLLIPVYTTHLTPSEYGILGLLLITSEILVAIFALGLTPALFRSYYDYNDEENRRVVISTAFFITAISCGILFFLGLPSSNYLSILFFGNTQYKNYLLMITIIAISTILNAIPFAIFRARMKSTLFIVSQISFLIIGIIAIIYFVVIQDLGILGVLFGFLIMEVTSVLILYFSILKDIVLKFSKHEARKMLHFGLPLVLASLSTFVLNFSDMYFLNYFSGIYVVGLYNLGYQFGMVMMVLFVTPIRLIWEPTYLSVKDHSNIQDFYSKALTYAIFIGSFLFLVLSLLSKEVIQIVANEEYWDAYIVVPLIALTYTVWGIHRILNVGIVLKRKTKAVAIILFLGAFMNLGLNFILIPRYGMIGAAYATLFSFTTMVILIYSYNRILIKIDYEWTRILKLCIVTALVFTIGYGVVINDIYVSIAFKTVVILTFPLILYLLRFYTLAEIVRIKEILGYVLNKLKLKA